VSAHKLTARVVGILFILASVTAIVGGSLLLPLEEADYLTQAATMENQIISGALIEMILVLSVVGIAVLLYPVLREVNEGLALAYVGTRMLEAVLLLAASVSALAVLGLSRDPGLQGAEGAGAAMLSLRDWTYEIGSLPMLGVSALILYGLLYRGRLVPSWLSLWGLAGGALILARGLLSVYGVELADAAVALLVAPLALNEMVLAVWLIVKGFNPTAQVAARDARRASGDSVATGRLAVDGDR
jgi:Domain of unknown function (DUF4386)